MIKKCIVCGKEFKADYPSKKYCSFECVIKDRKSKSIVTKKCEWCGKEFSSPIGEHKRFCSNECIMEFEKNHFKGKNNPVWKEKIILKCVYCGKTFNAHPVEIKGGRKFCSRECYENWRQKQLNLEIRKCKQCGNEFKVSHNSLQQFCSRDCYRKWFSENLKGENHPFFNRIKKKCSICGKEFETTPSEDKKFCSEECRTIYYKSENSPFRKRKTRICKECGKTFEVIPSKPFKFCSVKCANNYNSRKRIGQIRVERVTRKCLVCGKEFSFLPSLDDDKKFCSPECVHKYQVGKNNPAWNRIKVRCPNCNKEFETTPGEPRKFCSIKCRKEYKRKHRMKRICFNCKKEFYVHPSDARGEKGKFCSMKCSLTYLRHHPKLFNTSIELKMKEALEKRGIPFEQQKEIRDGGFRSYPDFYIELNHKKILVFCDGDFFHGNPQTFKDEKLPHWIIEQRNRDLKITHKLTHLGYRVLRFYEKEIENNVDECINKIVQPI